MPIDMPTDEFGLPLPTDWADHEDRWKMSSPDDATFASAVRYLNTRMFKTRDMAPISDIRKFNEMAYTLTKYRNQFCTVEPVNMQFIDDDSTDVPYKPPRTTTTTYGVRAMQHGLQSHKFALEQVLKEVSKHDKSLQDHAAQLRELSHNENKHPSLSKEDLLKIPEK